jgi:predicted alpha/beta superfamily hydrolase
MCKKLKPQVLKMIKIISISCALICLLALNGCGKSGSSAGVSASSSSSGSSSSSSSSGQAFAYLGSVQKNLSYASTITGVTYPYHVYLPLNYALTAKSYPVIYGTDAQWTFTHFSQTLDARHEDVIFVGIEEGPLNSNRRFDDFLGVGTRNYMKFFKTEFAPFIENTYRTNSERTYVGTSLGGLMGSVFLYSEPVGEPFFKNYMLFDGSFFAYDSTDLEVELARFNASKQLNVTLVLTSASPGNVDSVDAFQLRYQSRPYEGLKIYRRSYAIPHNDVANPSFDDNIGLLY